MFRLLFDLVLFSGLIYILRTYFFTFFEEMLKRGLNVDVIDLDN